MFVPSALRHAKASLFRACDSFLTRGVSRFNSSTDVVQAAEFAEARFNGFRKTLPAKIESVHVHNPLLYHNLLRLLDDACIWREFCDDFCCASQMMNSAVTRKH